MTISFVGFSSSWDAGTDVIVAPDPGTVSGDMMIAKVVGEQNGDITLGSGFIVVDEASHPSTNMRMESAYQELIAAPLPNYTFTVQPNGVVVQILTFRSDTGGFNDPTALSTMHGIANANANNIDSPSVTLEVGDAIVAAFGNDGINTLVTDPVDMVKTIFNDGDGGVSFSISLTSYYHLAPGATVYTRNQSWSGIDQVMSTAIVLRETTAGPVVNAKVLTSSVNVDDGSPIQ